MSDRKRINARYSNVASVFKGPMFVTCGDAVHGMVAMMALDVVHGLSLIHI